MNHSKIFRTTMTDDGSAWAAVIVEAANDAAAREQAERMIQNAAWRNRNGVRADEVLLVEAVTEDAASSKHPTGLERHIHGTLEAIKKLQEHETTQTWKLSLWLASDLLSAARQALQIALPRAGDDGTVEDMIKQIDDMQSEFDYLTACC